MSEWDTIKLSKAYQDGRKEELRAIDKIIDGKLLPIKRSLDEAWTKVLELEADVKTLKAPRKE